MDSDEVDGKYDCAVSEIRNLYALPRWEELKYADQFGCVLRMKLSLV